MTVLLTQYITFPGPYIYLQLHGSCFLFQCGPPSDFRCKFVNHANYTSAILDMSHAGVVTTTPQPPQPTRPPAIRPSLSEHELDLDKLRVKTSRDNPSSNKKSIIEQQLITTSTASAPLVKKIPAPIISTKGTISSLLFDFCVLLPIIRFFSTAPKCTRFQFQCKNGECIAIYDVCNGIPQCSDSTDEGPEVND